MSPNDKHSNYKISKNCIDCNLGLVYVILKMPYVYFAEYRDAWILPSLASIMLK
jgi:hypothetical protein